MAVWDSGVTTGMCGMAARLGLRFAGTSVDRGYQEEVGDLTMIGILAGEPADRVTDLMYGRYLDRNVEVFNLHLGSYPEDPSNPVRSCVTVTFAADFPRLTIAPHTRMSKLRLGRDRQWLNFAPEPFRQRFDIQAADNDTARSLLSDDTIGWLMAGRDDVRLTIEGGAVMGHIGLLGEEDPAWEPFIDFVVGFHGAILAG